MPTQTTGADAVYEWAYTLTVICPDGYTLGQTRSPSPAPVVRRARTTRKARAASIALTPTVAPSNVPTFACPVSQFAAGVGEYSGLTPFSEIDEF